MYFADEIAIPMVVPGRTRAVDKNELKLAVDLIERRNSPFDHRAYHDRYRERLMAIIDKKRKGETISVPEAEERRAPADLMAALEASLGEAVERRKGAKKRSATAAETARKPAKKKAAPKRKKAAPKAAGNT